MNKKQNIEIENIDYLKQQKILEILEREKNSNEYREKLRKEQSNNYDSQFIVQSVASVDKQKNKLKKNRLLLSILTPVLVGTVIFSFIEHKKIEKFISENNSYIILGKKYKEELEKKAAELRTLENININNIHLLPNHKKEVMLNLIPNGNPLTIPVDISSPFGYRLHPIHKVMKEHTGVDLRLSIGDIVISSASGKVVFAGEKGGYGKTIIIEHLYGFQTLYAHLDQINVNEGEWIGKGKPIGQGGNTGTSTGPHLHYEILYNHKPIDPENFINWNKDNFKIIFDNEKSIEWEYFLTTVIAEKK